MTTEIEKFIIENALKMSVRKIAIESNISRDTVRRVFKRNDIIVPEELRQKWKSDSMKGRTSFTLEEDEMIKENYLKLPIKTLGKIMNRSFCGISKRLEELNLVIPEEVRAERKAKGMFRKGQEPPNKGKKMDPEQYEKSKHTFFQKNHIPHNAKKDWCEVVRKDSSGRCYILIKLPGRRKLSFKHVWIWEEKNGKVPDDHAVVFKDGNTLNCVIENLECISRVELMKRNSIYNYPEELIRAIQLKNAIKRKVNKLKKQQE